MKIFWTWPARVCALMAWTLSFDACATTPAPTPSPARDSSASEPPSGYDRVEISCGTVLSPEPLFVAQVVRRAVDGSLIPVLGVTVLLETHGTAHASPKPTRLAITQDDTGRFSYRPTLWSDTLVY